jgi:protein SCO1/2
VFFGFTHCPDVCPTELQTIAAAMDKLGPDAKKVTPIFISVDPERDTVASIGDYVKAFGPRIVGLTGSPEQVAVAAKAYRVYYRKADSEEGADAKNYSVDHSAFTYLMDGNGQYLTHFSFGVPADKMAERIRQELDAEKVKLTLG